MLSAMAAEEIDNVSATVKNILNFLIPYFKPPHLSTYFTIILISIYHSYYIDISAFDFVDPLRLIVLIKHHYKLHRHILI